MIQCKGKGESIAQVVEGSALYFCCSRTKPKMGCIAKSALCFRLLATTLQMNVWESSCLCAPGTLSRTIRKLHHCMRKLLACMSKRSSGLKRSRSFGNWLNCSLAPPNTARWTDCNYHVPISIYVSNFHNYYYYVMYLSLIITSKQYPHHNFRQIVSPCLPQRLLKCKIEFTPMPA